MPERERRKSTIITVPGDEHEFDRETEVDMSQNEEHEERGNDMENGNENGNHSMNSSNRGNEIQFVEDDEIENGIEGESNSRDEGMDENVNTIKDREQQDPDQNRKKKKGEEREEKGEDGKEEKHDSDRIDMNPIRDKEKENGKVESDPNDRGTMERDECLETEPEPKQKRSRNRKVRKVRNHGNHRNHGNQVGRRKEKKQRKQRFTQLIHDQNRDQQRKKKRNLSQNQISNRSKSTKTERDDDSDSNHKLIGDTHPTIQMGEYPDSRDGDDEYDSESSTEALRNSNNSNSNSNPDSNSNNNSIGTAINCNDPKQPKTRFRDYNMHRAASKSAKKKKCRSGIQGRSKQSITTKRKRKFKIPKNAPKTKRQRTSRAGRPIRGPPNQIEKRTERQMAGEERCEEVCRELNDSESFTDIGMKTMLEGALTEGVQCMETTMMTKGMIRNNYTLSPKTNGGMGINAGIPQYFFEMDKASCFKIKQLKFDRIPGTFKVKTKRSNTGNATVLICRDLYITSNGTLSTIEMPMRWEMEIPGGTHIEYGYGALELHCNQNNLDGMERDRRSAMAEMERLKNKLKGLKSGGTD